MLAVVNPSSCTARVAALCGRILDELEGRRGPVTRLTTRGDGDDVRRLAAELRSRRPALVVAAGGDGTVRDVVQAMMEAEPAERPALGIVPVGTANNVGRSLGLPALRRHGARAAEAVLQALVAGAERGIDVGRVGDRYFVGSLAAGMDADILQTRNRLRARLPLGRALGGYPLYLWSCSVNAVRRHGGDAVLRLSASPGDEERVHRGTIYNLLVTNTPIYAGEFRFASDDAFDDGLLDAHVFGGAFEYYTRYPVAWRRHVRHVRGRSVRPHAGLQRVSRLTVELDHPMALQLDGEEMEPAASFRVEVVPGALRVRVPVGL